MVFSSLTFIFRFLPIFFILYFLTPNKYKNITLFIGSLVFYSLGEPFYIFLILISLMINYIIAIKMSKLSKLRKRFFVCGLVYNFGMLFVFKYLNFIIENINFLLMQIQSNTSFSIGQLPSIELTLPLGISFYTFQIASYLVDVYRNKQKPETSILNLGVYLCMFPQLIAGPIVLHSEVNTAIKSRTHSISQFEDGLRTFVIGLASKVIIANQMSSIWNSIQTIGFESISTPLAWIGAVAFSIQIYFDFNGYSLMAIGLGNMLGLSFPRNFNHPYIAFSFTDFWRRWHITLSRFFREYVYIPLGGNKKGLARTIFNLFIVWSLTGLWHGASWNFVIWGITFFILLTIEKLFLEKVLNFLRPIGHLYVIAFIPITWIIFAVTDLKELMIYLYKMLPFLPWKIFNVTIPEGFRDDLDYVSYFDLFGLLFIVSFLLCTPLLSKIYERYKKNLITTIILFLIFWVCIYQLANGANNPFLYFRF